MKIKKGQSNEKGSVHMNLASSASMFSGGDKCWGGRTNGG